MTLGTVIQCYTRSLARATMIEVERVKPNWKVTDDIILCIEVFWFWLLLLLLKTGSLCITRVSLTVLGFTL